MSRDRSPGCIDVHHHSLFPEYIRELQKLGITGEGGLSDFPKWDASSDLEIMDRHGIAAAVLSIPAPGVCLGDISLARRMARMCNDLMAKTVQAHPKRFGALAVLPILDIDASLKELAYAIDELKFDGVALLTNVEDRYLGDPMFDPIMEELNRRNVYIMTHPREADSSRLAKLTLPTTTVEFVFDTTRAVTNLIFSGCLDRFPNLTFCLSHAGGAVPYIAWRIGLGLQGLYPQLEDKLVHAADHVTHGHKRNIVEEGKRGIDYLRTRFVYDTALSATPFAFPSLRALVCADRILFGADHPFAPEFLISETIEGVREHGKFTDAELADIYRGNALRMLPQLTARINAA